MEDTAKSKASQLPRCPYCSGELPAPIRKRKCPHCQRTIYARSRPSNERAWIREEDIPVIEKEWADAMLKQNAEQYNKRSAEWLHIARDNIRHMAQSGVVKSVKLYTAEDESVCPTCKEMHSKVFPFQTPEQVSFVMDNAHIKNCWNVGKNSHTGCRCYWRPEKISLLNN